MPAPRRRGLALAALCMAAFVISLDTTIVNVALPSLVRQLHASTTDLQWVVDAYSLVFTAQILAAGSLSDRRGRKATLIVGLAMFGAASLTGSAATTVAELVAARAVMGLGAALIFPATLSLIANIFTERAERARAIGMWGATTGVGIALGPIVGDWLLERLWWGSVFLLMAPAAAAIATMVSVVFPLRVTRRPRRSAGPGWCCRRWGWVRWSSPSSKRPMPAGGWRAPSPGSPPPVGRSRWPSLRCRVSSSWSPSTFNSSGVTARRPQASGCCRWQARSRSPRWLGPGWRSAWATSRW